MQTSTHAGACGDSRWILGDNGEGITIGDDHLQIRDMQTRDAILF